MDYSISDFFSLLLGQGVRVVCGEKLEELRCMVGLPETDHHVGALGESAIVRMMRVAVQPRSLVVSWISLSKLWSSSSRAWAVWGHSDSRWVSESIPSQFRQMGLPGRSA